MKIKQISIFMENRSGRLANILTTLGDAGVNIRAMSLADTSDFGILRLIVSDIDRASEVLRDKKFTVRTSEVIAVEAEDTPGALAAILRSVEKAGINVEYMYSFMQKTMDSAVIIFRFEDPDRAVEVLKTNGIPVIGSHEMW
ncbi:amino acid-binding protein [Desulfonema ishimotonii]|uniref:Amino acid-binding protein n=1 Tax=Desulfonema ishimotonii TaxID=45657 RepID=A0A401FXJ4_9BACT|nr:ACT domain-containing protein [Desulfonema ishimotonii]GBC61681.1 amino acid-binding protein [Desulfonema ishimotonii]